MKRIFFPFLILTVSFFVTCQETQVKVNGNISGTVKDKQTSLAIDHCAVSIIPGNKQVYTSASGEFEFTDIIMGEYTVSFSKAGYNSYSRQITVEPDKTVKADAMLEPATAPVVNTVTADDIQYTQATIHGMIAQKGESTLKECGFYYGTSASMDRKYICRGTDTEFSATLQDLFDGTLYYYQAYAVNTIGEGKGEIKTFETIALIPAQVQTMNATEITTSQATLNGYITSKGNSDITECGFYFGATENPEQKYEVEYESDNFSITVTDLTDGATYYYCAYATNAKGEVRGEVFGFNAQTALVPTVKTGEATGVELYQSVINGEIISDGGAVVTECGFYFGNAANPTQKYPVANNGNGLMSRIMTSLSEGTTYYYIAYAINSKGESKGEERTFTTVPITVPEVSTHEVTDVTETTAKVSGRLNSTGRSSNLMVGFVYDTTALPELGKCSGFTADTASIATTVFEKTLSGLTKGTTYYVRAYATNEKGTIYGDDMEFTTVGPTLPKVETITISNITTTTARLNGKVTSIGERVTGIEDYGFVWSTLPEPTLATGEKVSNGSRTNTTTYYNDVTGLNDGTTYYVRAYAINEKGTAYGNEVKFTTTEILLPTVEVYNVADIKTTSAGLIGRVKTFGTGKNISDYGFVMSTSPNPTLEEGKMYSMGMATKLDNIYYYYDGASAGKYRYDVTGLTDGTTYYVRAYATNEKGTSYSVDFEFKTTAIVVPKVEVYDVTETGTTKSSFIGLVKSFGNAANISDYGFVWSTSPNPTLETGTSVGNGFVTKIDNIYYYYDGSSAGKYRNNVTGLQDGTTYYVRAYATNEKGTGYSEDFEFKTVEIVVPKLEVYDVTNISTTTSTYIGRINSFGNSDGITDYGFVWSTTPEPTLSDSTKSYSYGKATKIDNIYYYYDGSSAGKYALDVSSLTDGTTYYVRAYATNNKGTGYSADYEFTTKTIVPPTVDITSVSNIGTKRARFHGRMKSFGRATRVKDYGFVWDTIPNPTLETGSKVSNGSSTSSPEWTFYNDITGLKDGTRYYVRAYATNEKGTGYAAEDYEFTTVEIVIPTVTNNTAKGATYSTYARLFGIITSLGNADKITDYGFVISTTPYPTIDNCFKQSHADGPATTTIEIDHTIQGLSPSTKYYWRAYAINEKGVGYSEVRSFTTGK